MKEQNKTPEKELNETEINNLLDAEFKTLGIRMLKELTEYGNNIKMIQAEMKVILSEIKKTLQGPNSGRDETEYHINDLEHKVEKNNLKKCKKIKKSLGHLQMCQHLNHRDARRRRGRATS